MYKGGGSAPKKEPQSPSSRKFFYAVIAAAAILIVAGGTTAFFILKNRANSNSDNTCTNIINRAKDGKVTISICVRFDGSLVLLWDGVAEETKKINIYRKNKESNELTLWQTITIPAGTASGSFELGKIENPETFSYEFQGISADGKIIWKAIGVAQNASGTNNGETPGGNSNGQNYSSSSQNLPSNTPPPSTPPSNPPPSDLPPVQNPTTTPPTGNQPPPGQQPDVCSTPGYICYYSPAGQVTGTSTARTASFWVTHVNQKIEIGWQNLTSDITRVIIYRSPAQNNWVKLVEQSNPILNEPYSFQLNDNTISKSYYYEMETYAGVSQKETLGPILLEGLE